MATRKKTPTPPRKAAKPPVLNLKATEVKSATEKAAEKEKAEALKVPAKKAGEAAAKKASAGKTAAKKSAGKTPEVKKPADKKPEAKKPESKKPSGAAGKKPAAKKRGKGSLVLVSLLALAAAGGGGAWAFKTWGAKYLANPNAVTSEQLAGAVARIEKLEAGSGGQDKVSVLVADLKKQVGENAAALAATKDAVKANADKLAELEKTSGEIRVALARAVEDGKGPVAVANDLQFQALEKKIAGLQNELAGLKSAAAPDTSPQIEKLKTRLDALVVRLGAVEQDVTATSKSIAVVKETQDRMDKAPAGNPASELARAFTILRAKVSDGSPFEAELDNVAGQMPQETALDVLRPYAKSGAPTLAGLKSALAAVSFDAGGKAAPEADKKDTGLLGGLTQRLTGLVKVSKVGDVDWPAVKARAMQALDAGQTGNAIAVLKAAGKAPEAVQKWLAMANSKKQIDGAVEQISASVMKRLTAASKQ